MKLNKRQFKKWIEALDSGEYKQTRGILQNVNGYCCLGVACRVLIPENNLRKNGDMLYGVIPDYQPSSPDWLMDINADFERKTLKDLTALNDHYGFTFSEIATCLELVYIHKILD
jgi:hypothetical protein